MKYFRCFPNIHDVSPINSLKRHDNNNYNIHNLRDWTQKMLIILLSFDSRCRMKRNRSISSTGTSPISIVINVRAHRISFTRNTKVSLTIYSQVVDS